MDLILFHSNNSVPVYNANLQPAPPLPPDNIHSEHDRQLHIAYEQWLQYQFNELTQQQQFYESEVNKLRKNRKSLNSRQRVLRKSGNELPQLDAVELARITSQQTIVQKQVESSRKQFRQHSLLMQDFKSKQQSKMQQASPIGGPMAPQSPLMSPSPSSGSSQQALMQQQQQQTIQSPMSNNPLLQSAVAAARSPLHSPSPNQLMSQSPGPGSCNSMMLQQSPGGGSQANGAGAAMSPYNQMQPSPRIGTPHSQHNDNDNSPFSPTGGTG